MVSQLGMMDYRWQRITAEQATGDCIQLSGSGCHRKLGMREPLQLLLLDAHWELDLSSSQERPAYP